MTQTQTEPQPRSIAELALRPTDLSAKALQGFADEHGLRIGQPGVIGNQAAAKFAVVPPGRAAGLAVVLHRGHYGSRTVVPIDENGKELPLDEVTGQPELTEAHSPRRA